MMDLDLWGSNRAKAGKQLGVPAVMNLYLRGSNSRKELRHGHVRL